MVTGSSDSAAVGQLRSTVGQDETLVVVCATKYSASTRFIVDATSTEALLASWSHLIVGSTQAVHS